MSDLKGVGQWRLERGAACLTSPLLGVRIDPAGVQDGLTAVELEGRPLAGLHLLGLCTPDPASSGLSLERCRVRQRDLVSAYTLDEDRHAHVEAIWRILSAEDIQAGAGPLTGAGVELIVSVYTERLEDRVRLAIESRIPVEGLLGISAACAHDGPSGGERGTAPGGDQIQQRPPGGTQDLRGLPAVRFERLGPQPGTPAPAQTVLAPVCLLYSLRSPAGGEAGYVEAAAPSDVRSAEVSWGGSPYSEIRVRYPVFPGTLEKGVILRVRVRGVFLAACARTGEYERCAAQVHRVLAAADPVLGT